MYFFAPNDNPNPPPGASLVRRVKEEPHPASFTLSDLEKGVTGVLRWHEQVYPWPDKLEEQVYRVTVQRPFRVSDHKDMTGAEWLDLEANGGQSKLWLSAPVLYDWRAVFVWLRDETKKNDLSGPSRSVRIELDAESVSAMRRFYGSLRQQPLMEVR